ncbi:hypothetical protein BOSEA31B_12876 [Hyphomicrobiales bacterium]|nr:hypothetical protein BOSEA31B_12876 [Hyphomicrobiales bacterium]CAH1698650.1 hypothetical protein BOSEA1005_11703 [Hyphomicrobiales bacterium]CAI0342295.1 hypothetical protein BO1005MUT1_180074 [Hyphomicrobiales bacterium]
MGIARLPHAPRDSWRTQCLGARKGRAGACIRARATVPVPARQNGILQSLPYASGSPSTILSSIDEVAARRNAQRRRPVGHGRGAHRGLPQCRQVRLVDGVRRQHPQGDASLTPLLDEGHAEAAGTLTDLAGAAEAVASDRRGVLAAFALGASAVQVGTAYLFTPETGISPICRKALGMGERPTAITNLFTGRPARGIVNRAMAELGPLSELAPPSPPLAPPWGRCAAPPRPPTATTSPCSGRGSPFRSPGRWPQRR